MSNPFSLIESAVFTCADPDSSFVFEPEFNTFHWSGKTLDMSGKYLVQEKSGQLMIELEYNYAREQTFSVISAEEKNDELTAFVMKSHKTGKVYPFSRARI